MIEFILKNEVLSYTIAIVMFLLALIPLIKYYNTPIVKDTLYFFVCQAEKTFGNGTGSIKYASVISKFYYKMPLIIRLIFSEKQVDVLIEESVDLLKIELSKGKDLKGIE
jgi:hypothetical protein